MKEKRIRCSTNQKQIFSTKKIPDYFDFAKKKLLGKNSIKNSY